MGGSSASDCRWLYLSQMHWIHLEKNWSTIIKRPTPGFPDLWSWNEEEKNGKLPCLSKCFNITLILLVKMNDPDKVCYRCKQILSTLANCKHCEYFMNSCVCHISSLMIVLDVKIQILQTYIFRILLFVMFLCSGLNETIVKMWFNFFINIGLLFKEVKKYISKLNKNLNL